MIKHILFAFFTMLSASVFAQTTERQVVASAGGTYHDYINDFGLDYTIGEPAVATISNTSVTLTQGFQQPFSLIYVSVNEPGEDTKITIYPNPAVEHLDIIIDKPSEGKYTFLLYDILGQLLTDKTVTSQKNTALSAGLDFSSFATGNYFIRILHDNKEVKTLKIIKINQ